MDGTVSGADSLGDALTYQKDLTQLLSKGGFKLHKWASNSPDLLSHLPSSYLKLTSLSLAGTEYLKILGLQWNPLTDTFSYKISTLEKICTKRTLLSELARVFDPLGFAFPLTIKLKLLIQLIWSLGIDWDSSLPGYIYNTWLKFRYKLPVLSSLHILRHIVSYRYKSCEIHAFCDVSEKAYATVINLRSAINSEENAIERLLCSKSRVAP